MMVAGERAGERLLASDCGPQGPGGERAAAGGAGAEGAEA